MQDKHYITTAQAARLLGVSVATVKRWVDEGILPATKTAGGHRRLHVGDLRRLAQQNLERLPRIDWEELGWVPRPGEDPSDLCLELFAALMDGDAATVKSLIVGRFRSGISVEDLADELIAPTLTRVGLEWEQARIDVYQEHQATRLCEAALYELKAEVERTAERSGVVAVGGSPESDPTVVPNLLISLLLLDNGWEVINLGPQTPLASFERAIEDIRPRLLWLSMSHPVEDRAGFLSRYHRLAAAAERRGVAVVIGGRALTADVRGQMQYTSFGDGMRQLAALARTIHPRPRPPERGRPRGAVVPADGEDANRN